MLGKKIISLFIAVIILSCTAASSFAAGTVTYDADSQKFIFEPGSAQAPTDLFSDYKGLMPGDSVRQDITVKNKSTYGVKVKIYVRSLGAQEGSGDFLSKLHLTVEKSEDNKMAYMFDAAADQTDGMTDWVLLGTLYSGGEVNLVLNLDIPIDLDNQYQDAIGYIDWEFKVEEFPKEPDDPTPPQTGDEDYAYFCVIVVLFCGILVVLSRQKHELREED